MGENPSSCQLVGHEKQHQGQTIADLPEHILEEVFRRLPGEFLHSCLCVCRSFNKVILDTQSDRRVFRGQPLDCVFICKDGSLNFLDFYRESSCNTTTLLFSTKLPSSNSCNGLICYRTSYVDAVVCNPITGEFATLPTAQAELADLHRRLFEFKRVSYGLGYSKVTNQYKVLRMLVVQGYDNGEEYFRAEDSVYTLGRKETSWRRIRIRQPCELTTYSNGIYLGNSVHWLTGKDRDTLRIAKFDFDLEEFGEFFPPSNFALDDYGWGTRASPLFLGVLAECLSLCRSSWSHLEIWVMKEYSVHESWSKDFDIKFCEIPHQGLHENLTARWFDPLGWEILLIPLQILKDGRLLLAFDVHDLLFYDPVDANIRCLRTSTRRSPAIYEQRRHVIPLRPSLVSLKDIVNPDHLHVLGVHLRSVVSSVALSS